MDLLPVDEFCLLRSGRTRSMDGLLEVCTDVSLAGATPDTEVAFAVVAFILRVLRVLRLDEERWRRAGVGTMPE